MNTLNWKKWVGEYKDRLSAPSKTHLSEDGQKTLCGQQIPEWHDGYEVEWGPAYSVDCKKCSKAA